MACGCGNAQTEKYKVNKDDGTSRTFATQTEATVYAAKNGGLIVKL
ncbi:MAG: hypothetical protein ABW067_15595 [Rhizobacter sp.]